MSLRFGTCIFLLGLTLLGLATAQAAGPVAVDQSLANATKWLYSKQKSNGSWDDVAVADKVVDAASSRDSNGGQFTGRTALAALALLNSGESSSDPRIKKAVDFVLKNKTTGTYALGLRCQLWLALPKTPETQQAMHDDAKILLASVKSAGTAKGMYDYTPGPSKEYSHSRSQYAVLGLWAADQMGAEVSNAYWQIAEDAWTRNQSSDGGWGYKNPNDSKFPSTPGMTTVGVASLYIIQEQLRVGSGASCSGNQSNPAIDKGLAWLASNMDKFATGNTYSRYFPYATLYAYERVGAATGLRYFGDIDWYKKGADFAIQHQSVDGSWTWAAGELFDAQVDTCFAMLFLAKGRAPVVISKLKYTDATAHKDGKWNQRPRDVANITRWIGRLIERDLAFQIVTLDSPLEDMIESPILYVAGSDPLNLSDAHKQKLRSFIEAGGMLVANADCGNAAFVASIKKLGEELFPEAEFAELPQDDVIYTGYYPRSKWKTKPSVLALGNGARHLIVLIPQADAGKAWQLQDAHSKVELFELPADLLLYAVDQTSLRNRGDLFYLPDDPAAKAKRTITVMRLKYAGFWDPEPGGWRRLNNAIRKKQSVEVDTAPVELGKNQLGTGKIAHLTGAYECKFSDTQRDELKQFVLGGGTLVIDAAGGNSRFAASAENLLIAMFPDDKLTVLPKDHPLFSAGGGAPDEISYRKYVVHNGVGQTNASRLQGIALNGRLAVIYSREDLSVGLVGQPIDGILGYSPQTATDLMMRILNFASGSSAAQPGKAKMPK